MNLIEIKDINAPEMDIFARATERELRTCEEPEGGLFLAESANVILRAIEAGYEPYSVLVETGRLDVEAGPVFEAIEKYLGKEKLDSLPVYIADRDVVTCLTGHTLVRGLWMALKRKPAVPVKDFCKDKRRIAVLMDVVNPVNVGAGFRNGRRAAHPHIGRPAHKTHRAGQHGHCFPDPVGTGIARRVGRPQHA